MTSLMSMVRSKRTSKTTNSKKVSGLILSLMGTTLPPGKELDRLSWGRSFTLPLGSLMRDLMTSVHSASGLNGGLSCRGAKIPWVGKEMNCLTWGLTSVSLPTMRDMEFCLEEVAHTWARSSWEKLITTSGSSTPKKSSFPYLIYQKLDWKRRDGSNCLMLRTFLRRECSMLDVAMGVYLLHLVGRLNKKKSSPTCTCTTSKSSSGSNGPSQKETSTWPWVLDTCILSQP